MRVTQTSKKEFINILSNNPIKLLYGGYNKIKNAKEFFEVNEFDYDTSSIKVKQAVKSNGYKITFDDNSKILFDQIAEKKEYLALENGQGKKFISAIEYYKNNTSIVLYEVC